MFSAIRDAFAVVSLSCWLLFSFRISSGSFGIVRLEFIGCVMVVLITPNINEMRESNDFRKMIQGILI